MPFRFGLPATRAGRAAWVSAGAAIQKPPATTTAVASAIEVSRRISVIQSLAGMLTSGAMRVNPPPRVALRRSRPRSRFSAAARQRLQSAMLFTIRARIAAGRLPRSAHYRERCAPISARRRGRSRRRRRSWRSSRCTSNRSSISRPRRRRDASPRAGWSSRTSRASRPTTRPGRASTSIVLINPRAREEADAMDRERADKQGARAAARHSGPDQGQLRHRRHADLGRRARPGHDATRGRCLPGEEAARCRRGDPRQDDDARARRRHHQRSRRSPDRPAIPTICLACRAARAAAPARRSARASPPRAWAATPAVRFAFPPRNQNLVGLRGTHGLSSRSRRDAVVVDAGHCRTAGAQRHRSRDHARCDGRRRIRRTRSPREARCRFPSRIATRSTPTD